MVVQFLYCLLIPLNRPISWINLPSLLALERRNFTLRNQ